MRIYGDIQSGNCFKIKLLASLLDLEHEWIHVDILAGETHTADFLAMNPNAKIPLLVLDNGDYLSESNAILHYLASGSSYLPQDNYLQAQVLQWQFFEQYSHEPFIAVARFISKYLGLPEERRAEYEAKRAGGMKALSVMEGRLSENAYLVGEQLTIADISLYAYTHVAHEGGFDLTDFPNVRLWLRRIEAESKYIGMD